MATPVNRRRTALAEIPVRMSQLRVSTDEVPVLLNRTAIDSPLDNIPIGYLTPSPSQDELIIRQRGRRRSINWSPDKIPSSTAAMLSILRTPTKPTSTMTLRSSPRKRLQLDSIGSPGMMSPLASGQPPPYDPTARSMSQPTSSAAMGSAQKSQTYTPQIKRQRMTESPIAQQNRQTPLAKILKGLSQAQLIDIIQGIVNNEPNVEMNVRTNLPMPDIKPMEEQLMLIKKNIFRSLPTSRLVKNTDSLGHARASTHLATLKKTVADQAQSLSESENWDALIDYCLMSWPIVRATPIWDNKSHNVVRRSCFKILSWHCVCALKKAGIALGERRLNNLSSQIVSMKADCDDIASCEPHLTHLLEAIDP